MKLYGDLVNGEYVFDISAQAALGIVDFTNSRTLYPHAVDNLMVSMQKHTRDIIVHIDLPESSIVAIQGDGIKVKLPRNTKLVINDGLHRLKAAANLFRNVKLILIDNYERQRKIDNLLK